MLVPPSPIIKQIATAHNVMGGNIARKQSKKKMASSKKDAMQNNKMERRKGSKKSIQGPMQVLEALPQHKFESQGREGQADQGQPLRQQLLPQNQRNSLVYVNKPSLVDESQMKAREMQKNGSEQRQLNPRQLTLH